MKHDRQVMPAGAGLSSMVSSNNADTRADTSCRFPVVPHAVHSKAYGYAPACRCGKNTRHRHGSYTTLTTNQCSLLSH
ncbi:MAG: hypothetical protein ACTSUE_17375 [Promethearchaeota archaeon]